MEHGQFNIYTAAGKALLSLIEADSTIVNILDVGSWNGLGTTLCCVLGSLARIDYKPINVTKRTMLHVYVNGESKLISVGRKIIDLATKNKETLFDLRCNKTSLVNISKK